MVFYDTTLRDGEQTPGVCFTPKQKLEIAIALDEVGIREIEAGFPVVSEREFEAVRNIAKQSLNAKVFAFCRAKIEDIDVALKCDVDGVVVATSLSELHLKYKMKRSFESVFREAIDALEYASEHVFVSFTTEDATRIPLGKLMDIYSFAVEYADRIHFSDTVGIATPEMVECYVTALKSVGEVLCHFHNDFGLATANSVKAVMCGADRISVTVNGIGERAGNACLQEVATALELLYKYNTGIKLEKMCELSRLLEKYSGIKVHPLSPVVGENAFAHESGIHVAGVLENPLTYEPYPPELVGQNRKIVLGKHSGRRSIEYVMRKENYKNLDSKEILRIVKEIRERGYVITEDVFRKICLGVGEL